jgi:2-oxoglutarate ferredoxin oxidoreductase subunit alpha
MTERINDFVIKIANVNGTGSASANSLIMKAIFRMGVPVSGKNFFPSNIQGLPTWYEIRVSGKGHLSRSGDVDLMVSMNPETYDQDLADVKPGGVLLYDSTWPREQQMSRPDITVLGVPLARMCNEHFSDARVRILMKNICYAGVLCALLDMDLDIIETLLQETFGKKQHLVKLNLESIEMGYDYARKQFKCPLPMHVQPMEGTRGHILIDGNTAAALGCVYAGATVGAWYPITPSTSIMDAFSGFCESLRVDPETGERRFSIIQAEDELAAMGMVVGAAWNGARVFTPTSGPGLSLMSEFLGFAYFAEIPVVLFNVQRAGPSTGLPTRTQQCDIISSAYASHGDTRHVLLFPADPSECFTLSVEAFDLAERLQTPVIVLSDLDIGMNDWMIPDPTWDDDRVPDRGKVLSAEELAEIPVFQRYADPDGDAIPYRSLPGAHPKGAYFTRGSGHTESAAYSEDSGEYLRLMDRLNRKSDTAKDYASAPVIKETAGVQQAIVSFGSCDGAVHEAIEILASKGIDINYLRVRAFPFHQSVEDFIQRHEEVFVVEQNRDGQLRQLLLLETESDRERLRSVLQFDGMPIDSRGIVDALLAGQDEEAVA